MRVFDIANQLLTCHSSFVLLGKDSWFLYNKKCMVALRYEIPLLCSMRRLTSERSKRLDLLTNSISMCTHASFSFYLLGCLLQGVPCSECQNGCCKSAPCFAKYTDRCEELCDVKGKRFRCVCRSGYTGDLCQTPGKRIFPCKRGFRFSKDPVT